MSETSLSLLDRLRSGTDETAWKRFVDLYTPLIRGWLRRHRICEPDADDLAQDVMTVVIRDLGSFEHNQRTGAFRTWLRTVTAHRLQALWRSRQGRPLVTGDRNFEQTLEQLADPASSLSRLWDQQHDQHVARRLMELVRPQFQDRTWQAFRLVVLDGLKAAEVAQELGITVNAVLVAKSHVLARLRQEMRGLTDDGPFS